MLHARRTFPAIAVLATVSSCADSTVRVKVDHSFPPAAQAQIYRASIEWSQVTLPDHRITLDEGGDWHLLRVAPPRGMPGMCTAVTRTILLSPQLSADADVYAVAKHEFGHSLGLRHTCTASAAEGPTSSDRPCDRGHSYGVMDPLNVGVQVDISADDLNECRAAGACP